MLTCYVTAVQYEWMNNRERRGSNFDSRYKAISDRYKKISIYMYICICEYPFFRKIKCDLVAETV